MQFSQPQQESHTIGSTTQAHRDAEEQNVYSLKASCPGFQSLNFMLNTSIKHVTVAKLLMIPVANVKKAISFGSQLRSCCV